MNDPSVAAQVIIAVIPIVAVTLGAVVVFFYFLWAHRERMLLIQKGLWEDKAFDLRTFCLLAGIVLAMVGVVLSCMFVAVEGFGYSLLGGAIPLAVGAGLLLFYRLDSARRP